MTFWGFKRLLLMLVSSVFVSLVALPSYASRVRCEILFQAQKKQRQWQDIDKLVFMTFNVANIFNLRGKYERVSSTELQPVPDKPPRPKTDHHVHELRKIIDEIDPDVAVLTEVESLEALNKMAERLKSPYRGYLVHGNDVRDIDIGLIVKSDLNVSVEVQSHKEHIWIDPESGRRSPLFTRDLPVFLLRRQNEDKPFLIVFGMHAISRRGRVGDPHSNLLRTAQFDKAAQIIKEYQRHFGSQTPMMIAGDFNTDVQLAPEMQSLKDISGSAFDMAVKTIPKAARITHTFHEKIRTPTSPEDIDFNEVELNHMMQLDDIRFLEPLNSTVLSARVHRYTDDEGRVLPFALSWEERQQQTSDHLPVVVEVSVDAFS